MIRLVRHKTYAKVSRTFKMAQSNQGWLDFVNIIKPFNPYFAKEDRNFIFKNESDFNQVIEATQKFDFIEIDETDYEAIAMFERVSARRATCPDCGCPYEVEVSPKGQKNMYCEYCEG